MLPEPLPHLPIPRFARESWSKHVEVREEEEEEDTSLHPIGKTKKRFVYDLEDAFRVSCLEEEERREVVERAKRVVEEERVAKEEKEREQERERLEQECKETAMSQKVSRKGKQYTSAAAVSATAPPAAPNVTATASPQPPPPPAERLLQRAGLMIYNLHPGAHVHVKVRAFNEVCKAL